MGTETTTRMSSHDAPLSPNRQKSAHSVNTQGKLFDPNKLSQTRLWNQTPLTPRSRRVFQSKVNTICSALAQACEMKEKHHMATIFRKAAAAEYRNPESLIRDLRRPLSESWFAGNEILIFSLLFEMLGIGPSYLQPMVLVMLETFLKDRDLSKTQMAQTYTNLFKPAVEAFEMNLHVWQEALAVMDMGVHITNPTAPSQFVKLDHYYDSSDSQDPRLARAYSRTNFTSLRLRVRSGDLFWNQPQLGIPTTLNLLNKVLDQIGGPSTPVSQLQGIASAFTTFFDAENRKKAKNSTTSSVSPLSSNNQSTSGPSPRLRSQRSRKSLLRTSSKSLGKFPIPTGRSQGSQASVESLDSNGAPVLSQSQQVAHSSSTPPPLDDFDNVVQGRSQNESLSDDFVESTPRHQFLKLQRKGTLKHIASKLQLFDGSLLEAADLGDAQSTADAELDQLAMSDEDEFEFEEDLDDIYSLLDD